MLSLTLMGLLPAGARVSEEVLLGGGEEGGASSSPTKNAKTPAERAAKNLVELGEEEWRRVRGCEIAMIFQEPMTSLNLVVRAGTFVELGPAKLVLERPEASYTKELLAAVPEIPRVGEL
jgi:ABC-type dipeptide/oligopeptide/nickel transport system ATPase component